VHTIKKRLYFVVAAYFAFWAKLVLRRWQPQIIVVTGSTGKTTLLHLVEAQLGDQAIYSHHANSAIGLPFHILGMEPNVDRRSQWPLRFLAAPIRAFRHIPDKRLYVAEADTDRPHEGEFLATLLHPEITMWVSVHRTHSMNFDGLVQNGTFTSHEAAIAYEFGWFAAETGKLVLLNGDQAVVMDQVKRIRQGVKVQPITAKAATNYDITDGMTRFTIDGRVVSLSGLHPQELGIGLQMVNGLLEYLGHPLDATYQQLQMPPGRSSIFQGKTKAKKDVTIIDSTYNTGLGATAAMLALFNDYEAKHKWLVLGDILEQGSLEAEEHQRLADLIASLKVERVVLLGPRSQKYTLPRLETSMPKVAVVSFESPKDVLDYLEAQLQGGETVLFKGGRFLEGVIEQLLADPADAKKLVRREARWVKRRQNWGLPR
jgi:UDP-N-acetylmuramoyl-tripeptide--D-alanyl-D-alanine ligase